MILLVIHTNVCMISTYQNYHIQVFFTIKNTLYFEIKNFQLIINIIDIKYGITVLVGIKLMLWYVYMTKESAAILPNPSCYRL